MVMEIVRLCFGTTEKTLESITTCVVQKNMKNADIFARVPLLAVVKRVCLTNHPIHFDSAYSSSLLVFFFFFFVRYRLPPIFFCLFCLKSLILNAELLSSMLVLLKIKLSIFIFLHQVRM